MPPVWPSIPVSDLTSAVSFGGQLMVLTATDPQGCYRCLWPGKRGTAAQLPHREDRPWPVVGAVGTLQALETIKLLSGMATPRNTLRLFRRPHSNWRALALQRSRSCRCAGRHAGLV